VCTTIASVRLPARTGVRSLILVLKYLASHAKAIVPGYRDEGKFILVSSERCLEVYIALDSSWFLPSCLRPVVCTIQY